MHVHATTPISPDEVKKRFEAAAEVADQESCSTRWLRYAQDRRPPKFFLSSVPVTLPAAAEVAVNPDGHGTHVVLRLMWGPLPAPFPRAVAAAGILLGLLVWIVADRSMGSGIIASLLILLPLAALLYQRRGERELQAQLSRILGVQTFEPKPH
ncbi:MAG TPA: hypothetical protein VKB81_03110 [Nitrospira sp.]|nr:hypothetical protein [Nitrospira sp.]